MTNFPYRVFLQDSVGYTWEFKIDEPSDIIKFRKKISAKIYDVVLCRRLSEYLDSIENLKHGAKIEL